MTSSFVENVSVKIPELSANAVIVMKHEYWEKCLVKLDNCFSIDGSRVVIRCRNGETITIPNAHVRSMILEAMPIERDGDFVLFDVQNDVDAPVIVER